jgi:hypothetical protein
MTESCERVEKMNSNIALLQRQPDLYLVDTDLRVGRLWLLWCSIYISYVSFDAVSEANRMLSMIGFACIVQGILCKEMICMLKRRGKMLKSFKDGEKSSQTRQMLPDCII